MRAAIAFLLALLAAPAWGATYYVRTGGNNACVGTTDADGSSGACAKRTIQGAVTSASSGDTITVHGGTYTDSFYVDVDGYNTVNDRTFQVEVSKSNLTIQEYAGDTAIASGAGLTAGCVMVRTGGDGLVWDGIDCTNYVVGDEATSPAYQRVGIIHLWEGASNIRIKNSVLSGVVPNNSEFGSAAIRLTGSGTDNVIVDNVTISGRVGIGFLVEFTTGNSGIVFKANTLAITAYDGNSPAYALVVKQTTHSAPIVFYNNRITQPSGYTPILLREPSNGSHVYVFNNIMANALTATYGMAYTQDGVCPYYVQNVDIFNNTMTGSGAMGLAWQNYFSGLRVKNNIFSGATSAIRGYASGDDCGTHVAQGDQLWSTSTDKFTYNVVENSSDSDLYHGSSSPSPSGNIDVTGTVLSAGSQSSRDANNYLTATLGVATNDPLVTGTAGLCSITAAGLTIDCSLDINGDDRGTSWDAGADQYASVSPASTPSLAGGLARGARTP